MLRFIRIVSTEDFSDILRYLLIAILNFLRKGRLIGVSQYSSL